MPTQGGVLRSSAREGVCTRTGFLELQAAMLAWEREMQTKGGEREWEPPGLCGGGRGKVWSGNRVQIGVRALP